MIFILLYWILSAGLFIGLGGIVSKILYKKSVSFLFDFVNGLFIALIISWIINFFLAFSTFDFIVLPLTIIFNIVYWYFNSKHIDFSKIRKLPLMYKIFLFLVFIIVLYNSSLTPFLPDNESYYIQTIKWANTYGITKGLINLHPFLGQFSAWHILQAGINFKLFFNDLNGLFFLIYVFFITLKFDDFHRRKKNKFIEIFLGIQLLSSSLLLIFVNSPSPDLPVYILALLSFYLFLKNYEQPNVSEIKQLNIIVFLAFMIKLTAFPLLVLPVIFFWRYKRELLPATKYFFVFFTLSFALITTKNYIVTGYIFYPFTWFGNIFHPDWQYPEILIKYMSGLGDIENYTIHFSKTLFKDFYHWIFQGKQMTVVNILWLSILVLLPFLPKTKDKIQGLKTIYFIGLISFILILFISPNIRFYLYFYMFFASVLLAFYYKRKYEKPTLIIVLLTMIFINYFTSKNDVYSTEKHFVINSVSKYSGRIATKQIGNLKYYFVKNDSLFWQTGDAPIPAIQEKQIDYFKTYFHYIPQKRTDKLSDGFYMLGTR